MSGFWKGLHQGHYFASPMPSTLISSTRRALQLVRADEKTADSNGCPTEWSKFKTGPIVECEL